MVISRRGMRSNRLPVKPEMRCWITILACALVCVTGNAVAGGDGGDQVSFSRDVIPLLKRRCVACHITGQEPGLVSLVPKKAHGELVGVTSVQSPLNRITPADPEHSYLYHKLVGSQVDAGGEGEAMPPGMPPLSDQHIGVFRRWIEQGALDN